MATERPQNAAPDSEAGPACDLCGSADNVPIAVGRRFGREATIVMCTRCGLSFQSPRPSDAALEGFYRDEYRSLYSGSREPSEWFIEDQQRRGRQILERAEPWLSEGSRILDVGSGAGGLLVPFRDAGFEVTGLEPGGYAKWGVDHFGIDIRQGSDLAAVVDAGPFDLILLSFVLEHVPSPFEVLCGARGVLRQGGQLYVEVPNLLNARGSIEDYFHIAHLSYFTPATLAAMLDAAGFDLLQQGHRHRDQAYGVWRLATAAAREPRRPSPWPGAPLDAPGVARARLSRQRRVERVERVAREALKPALHVAKALARQVRGERVAERLHMSARRAWVKARTRL